MAIPASPKRIAWERKYIDAREANFQLFCVNGHGIGDELDMARSGWNDRVRCPFCGVGRPWLYRWEVD